MVLIAMIVAYFIFVCWLFSLPDPNASHKPKFNSDIFVGDMISMLPFWCLVIGFLVGLTGSAWGYIWIIIAFVSMPILGEL